MTDLTDISPVWVNDRFKQGQQNWGSSGSQCKNSLSFFTCSSLACFLTKQDLYNSDVLLSVLLSIPQPFLNPPNNFHEWWQIVKDAWSMLDFNMKRDQTAGRCQWPYSALMKKKFWEMSSPLHRYQEILARELVQMHMSIMKKVTFYLTAHRILVSW